MQFKGYCVVIDSDEHGVHIAATNLLGVGQIFGKERRFPYSQVVATKFVGASALLNGRIEIGTPYGFTRVPFMKRQADAAAEFYAHLQERLPDAPQLPMPRHPYDGKFLEREQKREATAFRRAEYVATKPQRDAEADARALQRKLGAAAKKYPAPRAMSSGVGHEGAEALAAEWMKHLGVRDARRTRYSQDGGIDVESARWLAQVKNYAGSVGVKDVREIYGVAAMHRKRAVFFTSGRYTAEAISFANTTGMPLFRYHAESGTLTGINMIAQATRWAGLRG